MNPQPAPEFLKRGLVEAVPQWPVQDGVRFFMRDGMSELVRCPHGDPGTRLWCRETFAAEFKEPRVVLYRADEQIIDWDSGERSANVTFVPRRWEPSIFMPRWASRITLEITGVRVERLTDISEADAIAEGVENVALWEVPAWKNYAFRTAHPRRGVVVTDEHHRTLGYHDPRESYASLWEAINGPGSWGPVWVWVLSFRRIT